MAGSSPARRSYNAAAVPSSPLSDILYGDRNSEARHKRLLETARQEHERVRRIALQTLENHQKDLEAQQREEERRQIQELERKERERIRREEELAAERKRLHELQAKKVEVPPEPKPTPKPSQPTTSSSTTPTTTKPPPAAPANPCGQAPNTQQQEQKQQQQPAAAPASTARSPFSPAAPQASAPTFTPSQAPQPAPPQIQPKPQPNGNAVATPAPPAGTQATPDRYQIVHRNLKELRRSMAEQAKTNEALKSRMGDMRREIRKCVGQLTHGISNKKQLLAIQGLLIEAMENIVQSQVVDPGSLVLEPREPVEGSRNGPLPSLFLYLVNIFAKAAISQFINEASARPETADPVGVTVAYIFAETDFLWRGKSLIDILLAKFRVVCPVVFGHRGNEKYEEGRRRLGWHKEGGSWVPEQQHFDRMTGLGAGFASISLRNFSRSKKRNPFPPRHYWTAMARIVNTPAAEISNTQAIVLKAMIEHYESKFLEAYGTAGRAALRLALVDFPNKCPTKTPATESLSVLAQLLKKETGLSLA